MTKQLSIAITFFIVVFLSTAVSAKEPTQSVVDLYNARLDYLKFLEKDRKVPPLPNLNPQSAEDLEVANRILGTMIDEYEAKQKRKKIMLGMIIIWIIAAIIAASIASVKNRNALGWILSSILLSPLSLLVLLVLPSIEKRNAEGIAINPSSVIQCPDCKKYQDTPTLPKERKCPYCAEIIKAEAVVCRFCNRESPKLQPPSTFPCKFCGKELSTL